MWEQLGLTLGRLERRPNSQETIAAALRQLLRAFDADDAVAACMATSVFCNLLRSEVDHRLRTEASWDSEGRWIDVYSTERVFLLRPDRVRVYDAMHWGLRSNLGRLWPEPFEADLQFSPGLEGVMNYRIRFGDTRTLPVEGVRERWVRVVRDIETGIVDWAFVWDYPSDSPTD